MIITELEFCLTSLSTTIVDMDITDHTILRPKFEELRTVARSSSHEIREYSIICCRFQVCDMLMVMQNNVNVFRRYIDSTMRIVLDMPHGTVSWDTWIKRYISKYLLLFLQGITMFASRGDLPDATMGSPAYHRGSSCGLWNPSDPASNKEFEENNLVCNPKLDENELERRRRNVWTCLVERLVYDALYNHFIGPQNIGHLNNEMRVTRRLFETCFAVNNIIIEGRVRLAFDSESQVPIGMTIIYVTPRYRIRETCTRQPSVMPNRGYGMDVNVVVQREVKPKNGQGPGDEYTRVQSYLQEPTQWLPISPGAPPHSYGGGRHKWIPNCPGVPDPWA